MNSTWELPESITVGDTEYAIRTDYRAILDILTAMNDPEIVDKSMSEDEKNMQYVLTMLHILYVDFDKMPEGYWQEATEKAIGFIDCGIKDNGKPKPRLMDWQQDAPLIAPQISKIIGRDIRGADMHWWTFLGYYMDIGDGAFATIVSIRDKLKKKKKLEKWEREYYKDNKTLIDLNTEKKTRSAEDRAALDKLLGRK